MVDLPLAEEQADETKGGAENYDRQIQVESFSWGATNPASFEK